jgi:hypothetical protein
MRKWEINTEFWSRNLKGRDCEVVPDADGTIKQKHIFEKWVLKLEN